jgi:tetratricopeptide (TPR) repeat protein
MEMWRRCGEAASAAALYSVYSGLYSEAVVSSVASAVALVDVGRFREAVEYVQKAAKALYEAAREVFERVKVTVQRLVELFVEAVTRVLAWVDEHKAYLFLMAAVAAGVVALSAALNMWGLVEFDKLAYAASLTPFIPAGVREHPREEAFKVLREAPDPYKRFKEIAKAANAGEVKLAEPWESLRVLILPTPSEESRLMKGKAYRELDEGKKKALFYAVLALEEAFGVYRSALREVVEGLGKAVQRVEVGEEPFRRVVYMADLGLLTQLAEEEGKAFEDALKILRKRLNEYAVRHVLRDLLDVDEDMARRLAEAKAPELSEFSGVNFGVKAYAALIAYREYTLGRRGAFGKAAWHWLEEGGSAWLFYYAPNTARIEAERAKVERPAEVGEMVVEAFRRLFLKPGADHYSRFVEELVKGGKLALMFEKETESSYVFKLYNMREGGGLVDLGIELWIEKVGKGIIYALKFDDVERWLEFFKPELETAMKAAEEVGGRLPVEDRLPYMLSWATSDVAITRKKTMRALAMSTSHLWQFAETHALFGWSVVGLSMSLTLEGPKLVVVVGAPLKNLDDAIRISAEGGWLKMLGTKAGLEDLIHVKSWDGLKQWVADHWGEVLGAVNELLKEDVEIGSGFDLAGALKKLEGLKSELGDDKTARKVIAPALLLIQAERLGVNEETLSYFAAVISDAVGGDGFVSAAMRVVILTSGEREIDLLWAATLAAYGIKTKAVNVGSGYQVVASGDDAVKLADLYFLYGPPLLEGDEKVINHKLVEVVRLGARGLGISWERLRPTKSGGAADLIISVSGAAVKYNVYLRGDAIVLKFQSTNRGRVELAARLLRLAGVTAEVKREGVEGMWYIEVTTDKLAAGREELRKVLAEIVKRAVENDLVDAGKAEGWLVKLEEGLVLAEELSKYGMWLSGGGALIIRFGSTSRDSIEQEAAWLEKMGLREGRHFSVKMPEGGKNGYVSILREGLAHAAWLSVRGSGEQQKLAADFVKYILERAKKKGGAFYEKVKEIIDEGMSRGSLTLEGFEKRVEVNGEEHTVKVEGWSAELEKGKSGKPLLRIKITAKVDDVLREYAITYGRYDGNTAKAFAYASADAPGGREADAKRFAAVIKALTGREPGVYLRSDGTIEIECGREHLDGFWRYKELADAIEKWLEQTEG